MITPEDLRNLLTYYPETGLFVWRHDKGRGRAGMVAGSRDSKGYVVMSLDHKMYKAHRLAWLYVHGVWPQGQIDHINGDKADNRIANLRDVTQSQNLINRPEMKRRDPLPRGVRRDRGRFQAYINRDGKQVYLGSFATPDEAQAVFMATAAKEYGEFLPTKRSVG